MTDVATLDADPFMDAALYDEICRLEKLHSFIGRAGWTTAVEFANLDGSLSSLVGVASTEDLVQEDPEVLKKKIDDEAKAARRRDLLKKVGATLAILGAATAAGIIAHKTRAGKPVDPTAPVDVDFTITDKDGKVIERRLTSVRSRLQTMQSEIKTLNESDRTRWSKLRDSLKTIAELSRPNSLSPNNLAKISDILKACGF